MNTVILFGSPRENGYTSRLVSAFCAGLPEGTPVRIFDAYEMNVQPCRSCDACSDQWFCPFDDMDDLLDALLECDVLVIASPVYHLSFPAPLKAIIDRTQRCFCAHRQGRSPFSKKQRKAAVLLTAGSPSENGEIISRQLRWLLPPLNAQLHETVVCANTDFSDIPDEILRRTSELAAELCSQPNK